MILAAMLVLLSIAQADATLPSNALHVQSFTWHDADTAVDVVVKLPYGVLLEESRGIRDDGYDAWEVGSRGGIDVTAEEKARGREALSKIKDLSVGKSLYLVPSGRGKRDSFGRLLGSLWLIGSDGKAIKVSDWAKANGHARSK
jgi:hypothetical protein